MAQLTCPHASFPVNSTDRSTTAKLPLGTRAYASGGREYVYVRAGDAIGALQAVRFANTAASLDDVVPTSATDQFVIGAADGTAFADLEYGFILTRGPSTVLATDAITAGVAVASGATAGLLIAKTAAHFGNTAGVVQVTDANADTVGAVIWMNGI